MKRNIRIFSLFFTLSATILYGQTTMDSPAKEIAMPKKSAQSQDNDTIPHLQNRIFALQGQVSDLNVYLSGIQVRLNEIIEKSDNNDSSDKTLSQTQSQVKKLQEELMTTDTRLKEVQVELEKLNSEITNLEKNQPNSQNINTDVQKQNSTQVEDHLSQVEKRIAQLEEKVKSMLGLDKETTLPEDMKDTKNTLTNSLVEEIIDGNVAIDHQDQTIKIKLNGNILFREGEVSISPQGQSTLQKIAPVLKNLKDKVVMVVGHTDTKPIGPNLKDFYPTNWELSTMRGTMVVRFLTEELKVNPELLIASGRSFYEPSENGEDRRAEIWIFPKLNPSFQDVESL